MSGREWSPGDVATATVKGVGDVTVFRVRGGWAYTDPQERLYPSTYVAIYDNAGEVTDARPLVVVDPTNTAQIEALLPGLRDQIEAVLHVTVDDHAWARILGRIEDDLAASLDPKPEEPTGLGAVVEAINDNRFVRVGEAGWVHEQDAAGEPCDWRDIAAVRVLSVGVSA